MKKFLLFAVTVCAALTMSAADRNVQSFKKADFNLNNAEVCHTLTAQKVDAMRQSITAGTAKRVSKAMLPAQNDVLGYYVADFQDAGDGVTEVTVSYPFEVKEYVDEDGTTYLELDGICGGYANVLGIFDEATSTITIPCQMGWEHETYGACYTVGFESVSEDGSFTPSADQEIVLQVSEDENGYYFEFAEGYVGMGIYLADQEKAGEYAGYLYTSEVGTVFNKANFIVFDEYRLLSNEGGWEQADAYPVFLEWIDDTTLYYHNFLGSNVEVNFDEEGNGTISTAQKVLYNSRDDIWFRPVAWDIADQGINYNPDREIIHCFFNSKGYFLVADPEAMEWEYYVLGCDEGYYFPLITSTIAMPVEEYINGISSVTVPSALNNTYYNLAGQRINKAVKGINIENGVKVVR